MSTVIDVESWTPVTAYIPETLVDSEGVAYTSWDLNDAGQFIATVLDSYTVGSSITVRLSEATLSTAKNHKWQLAVSLFRPGSGTIATATVTQQYQCGLVADLLALRTITIATSGVIGGQAVAAGDYISVTLTRIAATSDEDPNPIQMYAQSYVQTTTAGTGTGDCLGRVSEIITNVRDLFNDEGGTAVEDDTTIIGWINRCQAEIARTGYWRKTDYLSLVSGQRTYNLLSVFDDFVDIQGVRWASTNRPISSVNNRAQWNMRTTPMTSGAQPFAYFVENNTLEFDRIPTSGVSSGCVIEYAYLPDDLGCETNYTPAVSPADDIVYVHYALAEAFKRDRHAPGAAEKVADYTDLFRQALAGMTEQSRVSTSWGGCSGRLGTIIRRVRTELEMAGPVNEVSDYQLVEWANEVTEDLAREGYWAERSQTFSGIAAQNNYSLSGLQSSGYTLDRVLNVEYNASGSLYRPLKQLQAYSDYNALLYSETSGVSGQPTHYLIDKEALIVWPAPSVTSASGLRLRYSYLPSAFDCASGSVTPLIPPAHDQAYKTGILYKAFERANTLERAEAWQARYERARRELHGENIQREIIARPGR